MRIRIALYGATGQVGSRIAAEAVARGHAVTGLSRSDGVVPTGTTPRHGDATDADDVARIAAEHDVVVSAIGPRSDQPAHRHPNFLDAIAVLAEHVGSRRLIVVGHAGSLEVAPGLRLLDTSAYPERDKPEALAHATALEYLRDSGGLLHWVYVSPPPVMTPGVRTGEYRTGGDTVFGEEISFEDFAVAVVDEVEFSRHQRVRFSVAH